MPENEPATCCSCNRERTAGDKDYSPMQVITGQPCGWYSGDDGEICGHCMDETLGAPMTAADRPDDQADVIEAVALAISKHRHGSQAAWDEDRRLARALQAAHLLADPADRDDAAEDLVSVKVEVPLLRARLKRVEAERDQLRRWKAEAIPVMFGLQDLGKALGVRLGTRITGEAAAEQARALKAERDHAQEVAELAEKDRRTYHRDALRAEAEVAELREKVEELRLIANVNGDWNVKYDQLKQRADAAEAALAEANEWGDRYKATVERCKGLVDKVRDIHRPHACTGYPDCMILFTGECAHKSHCDQCRKMWPCPTVRALDGGES